MQGVRLVVVVVVEWEDSGAQGRACHVTYVRSELFSRMPRHGVAPESGGCVLFRLFTKTAVVSGEEMTGFNDDHH